MCPVPIQEGIIMTQYDESKLKIISQDMNKELAICSDMISNTISRDTVQEKLDDLNEMVHKITSISRECADRLEQPNETN